MTTSTKEVLSTITNITTEVHLVDAIYNPISTPEYNTYNVYLQDNVPDYINEKVYQTYQLNLSLVHDTAILCVDYTLDTTEITNVESDSVLKLTSSKNGAYWILPDGTVRKFPDFDTNITTIGQTKKNYICSNMDEEIEGIVQLQDGGVVIIIQGLIGDPLLAKSYVGADYFFTGIPQGCELIGDSIVVFTSTQIRVIHG